MSSKMSKREDSIHDPVRGLTIEEYAELRSDPRVSPRPLSPERYVIMASIKWGAHAPNRSAWDFVDMAMEAVDNVAKIRWRMKRAVEAESLGDGCVLYRVEKFEARKAALEAAKKARRKGAKP
jgi:hypothetical protein